MLDRVTIIKAPSARALPRLPESSADIVFVDGDHRYKPMKRDMLNARRVLRNGGILCGDDLHRELHEVEDMERHNYAIAKGIEHSGDYHPGITQAVDEVFGRDFTRIDRLWAARKTLHGWGAI
jgi:SAM-dependent methyltransferase